MTLPYRPLQDSELLATLRLIRSEHVGPVTFHQLVRRFGSPQAALDALPDLAPRGGKRFVAAPLAKAEQELEAAAKLGATTLLYGTPGYPAWLAHIHAAPPLLFLHGRRELLHQPRMLAIVGSRNASANGFAFAQTLAREAGARGLTIVSGLARGIDTAAHHGALSTGTIGVIGGGIDNIYPPENADLYKRMAESGLIVSEQPFGAAPQSRSFPARNRIIAGLSHATLVVEASLRSGSLITANFAAEQGREVFAVPGNPRDPRCQGTNSLLKSGAHLTESLDDILSAWPRTDSPPPFREPNYQPPLPLAGDMRERAPDHTHEHMPAHEDVSERARILGKLSGSPVLVDELAAQCNVPPGLLQAVLTELELAGTLVRSAGNRVALKQAV